VAFNARLFHVSMLFSHSSFISLIISCNISNNSALSGRVTSPICLCIPLVNLLSHTPYVGHLVMVNFLVSLAITADCWPLIDAW